MPKAHANGENLYKSPIEAGRQLSDSGFNRARARQALLAPSAGLVVVSVVSISVLGMAIPFDVYLLAIGLTEHIPNRAPGHSITIAVRLIWDCIILGASCYTLWGAVQMQSLANYAGARNAAKVACVPCVGPCCLLGIPFGAWAFSVLRKEDVAKAFES